jgi:hypothetical protein
MPARVHTMKAGQFFSGGLARQVLDKNNVGMHAGLSAFLGKSLMSVLKVDATGDQQKIQWCCYASIISD